MERHSKKSAKDRAIEDALSQPLNHTESLAKKRESALYSIRSERKEIEREIGEIKNNDENRITLITVRSTHNLRQR
jgi:hypothetical protein